MQPAFPVTSHRPPAKAPSPEGVEYRVAVEGKLYAFRDKEGLPTETIEKIKKTFEELILRAPIRDERSIRAAFQQAYTSARDSMSVVARKPVSVVAREPVKKGPPLPPPVAPIRYPREEILSIRGPELVLLIKGIDPRGLVLTGRSTLGRPKIETLYKSLSPRTKLRILKTLLIDKKQDLPIYREIKNHLTKSYHEEWEKTPPTEEEREELTEALITKEIKKLERTEKRTPHQHLIDKIYETFTRSDGRSIPDPENFPFEIQRLMGAKLPNKETLVEYYRAICIAKKLPLPSFTKTPQAFTAYWLGLSAEKITDTGKYINEVSHLVEAMAAWSDTDGAPIEPNYLTTSAKTTSPKTFSEEVESCMGSYFPLLSNRMPRFMTTYQEKGWTDFLLVDPLSKLSGKIAEIVTSAVDHKSLKSVAVVALGFTAASVTLPLLAPVLCDLTPSIVTSTAATIGSVLDVVESTTDGIGIIVNATAVPVIKQLGSVFLKLTSFTLGLAGTALNSSLISVLNSLALEPIIDSAAGSAAGTITSGIGIMASSTFRFLTDYTRSPTETAWETLPSGLESSTPDEAMRDLRLTAELSSRFLGILGTFLIMRQKKPLEQVAEWIGDKVEKPNYTRLLPGKFTRDVITQTASIAKCIILTPKKCFNMAFFTYKKLKKIPEAGRAALSILAKPEPLTAVPPGKK